MTETPSPLFKRRQTAIEAQTSPTISANSQGNNIFFVKTRLVCFDYPFKYTIRKRVDVLKIILVGALCQGVYVGYKTFR
ncbi:hypothetical protein A3207_01980 [Candidatus Methanomassiliicoccus intestinalis]|uniref:Uncharacterized protein n=2 Tax=Candidatus Methanomassiliicoccus intestinalis TaxID=1406512 RepID=R9T578_METII|nr:hypothetical protein MMINT_07255 [Candidatus Methanomassiliicoccus intestinalis Issoire-Mx1]TQS82215.1 MAG: hypothetical protein A3206_00665 [Candidatus Methanomassiliicoccus intestinalis]TQS84819.1 MAG: hypothetical protein A3207_01980 [Candidatus Methanomassiliicoccus intestinalis]